MKQLTILLALSLLLIQTQAQELHHNSDITNIFIEYDVSCMQTYQYKTDTEYIVEDNYTNFHIKVDETKTFILKIRASNEPIDIKENDIENHYVLHCESMADVVDNWFIYRVNHGGANIFFKLNTPNGTETYIVDYVVLREMDEEHLNYYGAPHFALKYRYDTEHNPGIPIPLDFQGIRSEMDVRYYLHGMTFQNEIRKDIFLKIYNDACHNREYGVTTPLSPVGEINPYLKEEETKVGDKKIIFRSCQHPIVTEIIKGIGLYKEYYQEEEKVYKSELVSIDGIPIEEYLTLMAGTLKEEKEYKQHEEELYFAMRGNTKKGGGGGIDASGNPIQPLQSVSQKEAAVPDIIIQKSIQKSKNNKKEEKTSQAILSSNTEMYLVKEGDTLYNISKRYNTTVDKLKELNNMTSNLIIQGAEIKVPK